MTRVARVAERLADRLRGFAQPWELGSFIWVPAIVVAYAFWQSLRARTPLDDFGIFRTAAKAVLRGDSPYVAANPQALAHFDKFVYPPSTALLFSPFTALAVKPGSSVKRGDVVGYVGSTGRSTGVHLHYEILANGQLINPLQLLTQPTRR